MIVYFYFFSMDLLDKEIKRFSSGKSFRPKKWRLISKSIELNVVPDISDVWKQAIQNQFTPSSKPIWALFKNGTVVFVPTIRFNAPEGIESFSQRVITDHGNEITNFPADNDFLVVSTPNMQDIYCVKHGPAPIFWTIIDKREIPEKYHQYITTNNGFLTDVAQLLIGSLAQKKRYLDAIKFYEKN